jgi:hypothetical protein
MCLRFVCRNRSYKREILVIRMVPLNGRVPRLLQNSALSFTYQSMLFVVHFEGLT